MIQFQKLHNYATAPTRGTTGSAGFDLYSTDNHQVWPGVRVKIPTGIRINIPDGWAGFVWPRSGMAVRHGFDMLAGLIDSDYRGEITVAAINHGDRMIEIKRGDRIAQIVFSPVMVESEVVDSIDNETERGAGGFGSTGV